jgi:hypothetical protein
MKNTMVNSNEFYAGLTPLYHLVYPDWGKSLKRQADMLDSVIHEIGYVVTASDLSSEEGVGRW